MSFAPMVSSTASSVRSARWRCAIAMTSLSSAIWLRTDPGRPHRSPGSALARPLAFEEADIDGGA